MLIPALLTLAETHGDAPMLGRTLMQPAQVISLGFKLAGWVAPLVRAQARLRQAGAAALQLQLGGAVGTRAALGEHGDAVLAGMAQLLGLRAPPAAWHTQRDELVALGCELGVLAGSLGKIAKDISLMAQGEVGELAEPSGGGRGGSSAMPHKRNPVAAMTALAAAVRTPQRVAALLAAMPQEHERGLGNWQAELAEFGGLLASVHGALAALTLAAGGLQVFPGRMRRNIDALQGLVFAEALAMRVAREIGKSEAHHWVEGLSQDAVARGAHLREVALAALGARRAPARPHRRRRTRRAVRRRRARASRERARGPATRRARDARRRTAPRSAVATPSLRRPMDREDDFDRGVKNRRAVLGDAWVDKSLGNANAFNADFQALITRYAWNDIWGRPGLDHTTRRLLVLGMTMGLARWEEFELHCGAAIRAACRWRRSRRR